MAPSFTRLGAQYTEPMILDYIVSVNTRRRHLSAGQRAMLALEYERAVATTVRVGRPKAPNSTASFLEPEKSPDLDSFPADKNDRKTAAHAAKATGASRSAVSQAKAIQRDAPDLAEKVRCGAWLTVPVPRQRPQSPPGPLPLPPHAGQSLSLVWRWRMGLLLGG